jgi:condensin complex subunit 1
MQLTIYMLVCSEIAAKQFSAQDSKGPRSFSKFVIKLAELSPRLVLKQISLLQKHLDSEVWTSPHCSAGTEV